MALVKPSSEHTGWLTYDWLKLAIAIILLLLLLWWWFGGGSGSAQPSRVGAPAASGATGTPIVVGKATDTKSADAKPAEVVKPVTTPAAGAPAGAGAASKPLEAAKPAATVPAGAATTPVGAPTAVATTAAPVPAGPAATKPAGGGGSGPNLPVITAPAPGSTSNGPILNLTGTGVPGGEVEILDNGLIIGKAIVAADGAWRFTAEPGAGVHRFSTRPVGNAAAASAPVEVTVGGTAGPLAITSPGTSTLVTSGEVTLTGTAPPNSQIELFDKGVSIGTLTVAGDGRWSWTARPIGGPHSYSARLVSEPRVVSNQVTISAGP